MSMTTIQPAPGQPRSPLLQGDQRTRGTFAPIKEDSTLLKIISCLPIIGTITSTIQINSITEQLMSCASNSTELDEERFVPDEENGRRKIRLLEVRKHYRIADAFSRIVTIALLVHALVLKGFLLPMRAVGFVGVAAVNFIWQVLHAHKELMKSLR